MSLTQFSHIAISGGRVRLTPRPSSLLVIDSSSYNSFDSISLIEICSIYDIFGFNHVNDSYDVCTCAGWFSICVVL